MDDHDILNRPRIMYSCYFKVSREGEQFVNEHVFSYIKSGSLLINDGKQEHLMTAGTFAFYGRDTLAKFAKMPDADVGEFKALSIRLDKETLQNFAQTYGYSASGKHVIKTGIIKLEPLPVYHGFADSLLSYLEKPESHSDALLKLKVNEAIMILLETKPEMTDILFDFNEPGKIDLKAFMARNFHFNVDLSRFAYLTGRSLSTFKRDFEKIFSTTPNKWLQQKRLEEAHFLITKRGKKPSDVYLEVGFENLSHFSFAFKKAFGKAPSQLITEE